MTVPYDEVADLSVHRADVQAMFDLCAALRIKHDNFELALDLGGGLGLHAIFLQPACKSVYVADVIPYNSLYEGALVKQVIEKCKRNNLPIRPESIEFHNVDAQKNIYRDNLFDLVFSINAFEHIPDPVVAFREAIRICKPGGIIYLKFDPLWHSAYGHHMFEFGFEPWEHLLLGDEEFKRRVIQKGGTEKNISDYDYGMNRKKYNVFEVFVTIAASRPIFFFSLRPMVKKRRS